MTSISAADAVREAKELVAKDEYRQAFELLEDSVFNSKTVDAETTATAYVLAASIACKAYDRHLLAKIADDAHAFFVANRKNAMVRASWCGFTLTQGDLYRMIRFNDDERKVYTSVVTLLSDEWGARATVMYRLANVEARSGNVARAKELLADADEYSDHFINDFERQLAHGETALAEGRYNDAERFFEAAYDDKALNADRRVIGRRAYALWRLAVTYKALGEERALKYVQELARMLARSSDAWYLLDRIAEMRAE